MLSRPPALRVSEMHRRYGFGRGECHACIYLYEVRRRHAVCTEAVPKLEWFDPKYKWDRMSPACGIKKVGP